MFNRLTTHLLLGILVLSPLMDVEARGGGGRGGGGGGRGGGGGGRSGGGRAASRPSGSRNIQRSPSMSRASSRPQQSARNYAQGQNRQMPSQQMRNYSQAQPRQTQARQQLSQQRPGSGVSTMRPQGSGSRLSQASGMVGQGNNASRQQVASRLQGQLGSGTGAVRNRDVSSAQQFLNNRPAQQNLGRTNANNLRNQLGESRPEYRNWFNNDFFDRVGYRPDYVGSGANLWKAATWAGVSNWLGWGAGYPYYYDYAAGSYYEYPSYASSSTTYPSTTSTSTTTSTPSYQAPQQYTDNTTAVADVPTNSDWLPLGVFALSQQPGQAANANMFLQLALNKNGEIDGTYYNTSQNQTYEVIGMVDRNSQEAVMQLSNNANSPTLRVGAYNLTEDQTQAQLKFTNGTSQNWTMTRVTQ